MASNAATTHPAPPPAPPPVVTSGANRPSQPVAQPLNTQQGSASGAPPAATGTSGFPTTATNAQPPPASNPTSAPANGTTTSVKPKEWISVWLRWYNILITAGITMSLLSATITLTVISAYNHGFTATKLGTEAITSFLPTVDVGIGVVWTFLPSLIFQLYGLTIAAIVKAAGSRQPYIELREARLDYGTPPEKSTLLDYQTYWFYEAPYRALQYNHYMLAYSFIVAMLVKTLLAPLGAHLFYTTTISVPHEVEIQQTSFINKSNLGANADVVPVLEVVSSTLTYGAKSPPWTTFEASFAPMSIPSSLMQQSGVANLTVPTRALAAHMSCSILGSNEFELGRRNGSGGWDFRAFDRGCASGENQFIGPIANFQLDYLYTHFMECSWAALQSRILVIGAQRENSSSNSGLKNITAVSCIPTYSHSTGSLTVSFDAASPNHPSIYGFTDSINTTYDELPQFGAELEVQLSSQPQYPDISDTLSASGYGNVIYRYAKMISPDAYMSGDVLLNATSATFSAAFAVAASEYIFQAGTPEMVQATYLAEETRVVVVVAIASTICSLLFLALVMLTWIGIYTRKHHSILYEEPKALVSAATILRQSALLAKVQTIAAATPSGKVSEAIVERQKRPTTRDKGWYFECWDDPKSAVLKEATRSKPFGFFSRH